METNPHAMEAMVEERLARAREEARRLERLALARPARRHPRVRLGTRLVRPAEPPDNPAIAAIWNHEVLETTATTDTEPRGPQAQRVWLAAHGPQHPVIVAVDGGEVVAFGALSPYRAKPSYARTVEDSVYVREGWRGKGLGGQVLDRLLVLARERGHRSVIARITGGNDASVALHERRGFVRVGHERQVALKHGMWLDVVTLQRILSA